MDIDTKKQHASEWFRTLRDSICTTLEALEKEAGSAAVFERKIWQKEPGELTQGGGEMSLMRGKLFEKAGVNISLVHGEFSEEFQKEMPKARKDPRFWASGISLVIHPASPHVPAVHMNTRMIVSGESNAWFGGGTDLTPTFTDEKEAIEFHQALQQCCELHDAAYYPRFKQWCDEYFYLPHREEPRGIGGIFYDYLQEDWAKEFAFTQGVGRCFEQIYPQLVRAKMNLTYTDQQKDAQRVKRGRYVEFNLLHDRGTRFGLMTGGNTEAILMSLPPDVSW